MYNTLDYDMYNNEQTQSTFNTATQQINPFKTTKRNNKFVD